MGSDNYSNWLLCLLLLLVTTILPLRVLLRCVALHSLGSQLYKVLAQPSLHFKSIMSGALKRRKGARWRMNRVKQAERNQSLKTLHQAGTSRPRCNLTVRLISCYLIALLCPLTPAGPRQIAVPLEPGSG